MRQNSSLSANYNRLVSTGHRMDADYSRRSELLYLNIYVVFKYICKYYWANVNIFGQIIFYLFWNYQITYKLVIYFMALFLKISSSIIIVSVVFYLIKEKIHTFAFLNISLVSISQENC